MGEGKRRAKRRTLRQVASLSNSTNTWTGLRTTFSGRVPAQVSKPSLVLLPRLGCVRRLARPVIAWALHRRERERTRAVRKARGGRPEGYPRGARDPLVNCISAIDGLLQGVSGASVLALGRRFLVVSVDHKSVSHSLRPGWSRPRRF